MYYAKIIPLHGFCLHGAWNLVGKTDIEQGIIEILSLPIHFMRVSQFWYHNSENNSIHIYICMHAGKNILYKMYWPILIINIDLKMLNKILVNLI